jgi:Ca2+-transporting ATPase
VDESALTGESVPVSKRDQTQPSDAQLADRVNMAYASTLVTYGQAKGIAVATGDRSEVGRISQLIAKADDLKTPLTGKIAKFSHLLLYVILALAGATFVVGLLRGELAIDMFMAAVALAVGAIPEGLPAAVTIILAIGVARMAQRRAVIRKLPAVETLGSTTVICSDKTGTITQNQMTVREIFDGGTLYAVTGVGYDPTGRVEHREGGVNPSENDRLVDCLRCGALCNDALLVQEGDQWTIQGDPTEGGLLVSAHKLGLHQSAENDRLPRIEAIPFESQHQYMATLHDAGPTRPQVVYVKGAVEVIVDRCGRLSDGSAIDRDQIMRTTEAMASQGLRVLAMARKDHSGKAGVLDHVDVADGLTFLGLQGMIDPPRQEVIDAVAVCKRAGIAVKMITGDHAITAGAIAREVGIIDDNAAGPSRQALSGRELEALTDEQLAERVDSVHVYARVTPEQKLRLVRALQRRGHIVAMTGDGVNDAPALKQANIGVAMGIGGTEVAKEAADMVLTDDNFATIKAAVEEGRGVYDNLVKFIGWTLPTNAGEGLLILAAVVTGATLPLLPVHILWINMTTAVLLGMMLAFEPHERDLMTRPPHAPDTPLLTRDLVMRIGLVSLLMLVSAFGLFQWELASGRDIATARTVAVNVFVVIEAFYLFNCRSFKHSMFHIGLLTNPWMLLGVLAMASLQMVVTYVPLMNRLLETSPISAMSWMRILLVGLTVYLVVGFEKWVRRRVGNL